LHLPSELRATPHITIDREINFVSTPANSAFILNGESIKTGIDSKILALIKSNALVVVIEQQFRKNSGKFILEATPVN